MLGQVDIGTLAQRRTNGWQMVGPTLAHCRPNIGMFMGVELRTDIYDARLLWRYCHPRGSSVELPGSVLSFLGEGLELTGLSTLLFLSVEEV